MKKINLDSSIKFFIIIIGLLAISFVLIELKHIFLPFVIAYFLYFIFEPLNSFLSKYKFPSGVLILINIIIAILFFWGISKIVVDSFAQFGDRLPYFETKFNALVSKTAISLGIKDSLWIDFKLENIVRFFDYSGVATGIFSSTLKMVTYIFLILFFFIFISSGHKKIFEAIRMRYVEKEVKSSMKKIKRELKSQDSDDDYVKSLAEQYSTITIERESKLRKTFRDITEQIQKYIVTKFFVSLLLGVLVGIITWAFGIEFFIVWATLSIILNFIPNIGSVFAVALISLMTLMQFESIGYAVLVLVTLIVVQNLIGNILEPKIFGDRLGLNPLVILFSLMIWGYLWGITGMFLSVPLTAVVKIIISNSTSRNMRFLANLMSN
jgi:predicted PurR-regulated permease PerM